MKTIVSAERRRIGARVIFCPTLGSYACLKDRFPDECRGGEEALCAN